MYNVAVYQNIILKEWIIMSRRRLKSQAKAQIRGNVIILFIIGIIADIDKWFYSISSGAVIRRSGILGTLIALATVTSFSYTQRGSLAVRTDLNKLIAQANGLSGLLAGCGVIFMILYFVVGSPLRISFARTYLDLTHDEKPKFSGLGFGFKNCWEQSVLLNFFKGLFLFLWTLLFVIPGIIKSYSYSMTNYIMADEPDISALDAITKSRKLMSGHKFSLFILDISFFFWYLLAAITFGIANIYIKPYIEATKANFYLKVKEEAEPAELKAE